MGSEITINAITGTSPYYVYLCDTGSTICVYINQITDADLPYTFSPPVILLNTNDYLVQIIDSGNPCTIIASPRLLYLSGVKPLFVNGNDGSIYSFDTSGYTTSFYFTPTPNVGSIARNDERIWIYDPNQAYIFEYDATTAVFPTLIRQIDTLSNAIEINNMCTFSGSTELLTINQYGDVQIVDISSDFASVTSTIYYIGAPTANDCNILRDDNIGVTYIKTSYNGFQSFYDNGTTYSYGTFPSGTTKGFFKNPSTGNLFGLTDDGSVFQINQDPGMITPTYVGTLFPDNVVGLGLAQSNTATPSATSFTLSIVIENPLTAYTYNYTIGYSSDTFSWINWGDSNVISGGTTFGTVGTGSISGHQYTPIFSGNVSVYSYDNFAGFKTLDTAIGYNATGITQSVTISELKKITGLEEYYNYGFGYFQLSQLSGYIYDLPPNLRIIKSTLCNLTGTTSDFPAGLTNMTLVGGLNIGGDMSLFPSTLTSCTLNTTISSLVGETSSLPPYLESLTLLGSSNLYGDTSGLYSGMTYISLSDLSTISGDTSGLSRSMTYLVLGGSVFPTYTTISGDVANLPPVLDTCSIAGYNTISGDTSGIPSGITNLFISGYNTISGLTSGLPISANTDIYGYNTISGSLSGLPAYASAGYLSPRVAIGGDNTINGELSTLPGNINVLIITQTNSSSTTGNTISGNISGLTGSNFSYLYVGGANTISGDTSNIPTATTFTFMDVRGLNTLSGNISNIPSNIDVFRVYGNNTIGGDISGLPTTLTTFDVRGNNTISGGFSGFNSSPLSIVNFFLYGGNIDYSVGSASGITFPNNIAIFDYVPTGTTGTALSSTDVDTILVAATGTTWGPGDGLGRYIRLTGGNSSPTGTGTAAISILTGSPYNLTIYTN